MFLHYLTLHKIETQNRIKTLHKRNTKPKIYVVFVSVV